MLKKLLKHEYKATARFFLPAYGIFAALLVVERVSMLAATHLASTGGIVGKIADVILVLFTIATVLGLIALLVSPLIYAIYRFYRNMLGDEGYLSFTLPVTTGEHIWCKLLAAWSWGVLTALVVALCGCLFFLTVDAAEVTDFFRTVGEIFREGCHYVGAWVIALPLMVLAALLCQLGASFLTLYSAMSIGQTANKHKFLASAGAYIGIQFATSTVLQILGVALVVRFAEVETTIGQVNVTSAGDLSLKVCQYLFTMLLAVTFINVLLSTLHYFLSRHFLSKRLNLA